MGYHAAKYRRIPGWLRSVGFGRTDEAEAQTVRNRVLADPHTANEFRRYQLGFEQQHRVVDRLYQHQTLGARDAPTGGKLDSFRVFAERMMQLAGPAGAIGMLVPSAFHANEGATGIRRLYLRATRLQWCLSFENRRKLFDIHASFKFTLVVARRPGPTRTVRCAFYLTDFAQIEDPERLMNYDFTFIGHQAVRTRRCWNCAAQRISQLRDGCSGRREDLARGRTESAYFSAARLI